MPLCGEKIDILHSIECDIALNLIWKNIFKIFEILYNNSYSPLLYETPLVDIIDYLYLNVIYFKRT